MEVRRHVFSLPRLRACLSFDSYGVQLLNHLPRALLITKLCMNRPRFQHTETWRKCVVEGADACL